MGKVIVDIKLTNFEDIIAVKLGARKKEDIRILEIKGMVDTGATMLSIPVSVFEKLGLSYSNRTVTATCANGKKEKKKIAQGVIIEIEGREVEVECVVEDNYDKVLIGQIPLEYMDLHIDCKNGKLVPNPLSPDMPMIEILLYEQP